MGITAKKTWMVECDCGRRVRHMADGGPVLYCDSRKGAIATAIDWGWKIVGRKAICPKCWRAPDRVLYQALAAGAKEGKT